MLVSKIVSISSRWPFFSGATVLSATISSATILSTTILSTTRREDQ